MSLIRLGTREVVTATPEEDAATLARRMEERRVGSLVVVRDGKPVGIVTDRDLVLRVMAAGEAADGRRAEDVMSGDLAVAEDDLEPIEAAWRMRKRRVRRLPIVDGEGRLGGIVTLDDLVGHLVGTDEAALEMLASFHDPYRQV